MTEVTNGITLSRNDLDHAGKGSYILIIKLPEEQTILIGKSKAIHLSRGYYAYVGSALGGIKSRLAHHLRENKKPHWHIDYLLQVAATTEIIICETEDKIECTIAGALSHQLDYVPGFGSSDCKCRSHLFFAPEEKQMKSEIMSNIDRLKLKPRLVR